MAATTKPTGVISYNPELKNVRVLDAQDAALPTDKGAGFNCAEFDEIVVVGTVLGGATAFTLVPYFWSDSKNGTPNGGFVPALPAISLSFTASGQRTIIRVAHHGSVWLHVPSVTAGAGERVRLEVAGIPVFDRIG